MGQLSNVPLAVADGGDVTIAVGPESATSLIEGKGPLMNPAIQVSISNELMSITLSRPEFRNALAADLIDALSTELSKMDTDSVKGIIINAQGSSFCAGHDFRELLNPEASALKALFERSADLVHKIRTLPIPVISQVQGGAIGAGCQLALACDFVIASQDAFFQTPGGARGWFCFSAMVAIQHTVAPKRALEMLFKGEPIAANQALDWGMINQVVESSQLTAKTIEFAESVTRGDKEMLALGKKAFYEMAELSEESAYKKAAQLMTDTCTSESAQNRIKNFANQKAK